MSSSSAPRDDATMQPREEEERDAVIARRTERMAYSRELLLAVGSLEACKLLPADADLAKHPDDAALWVPSQTLAGGAPGGLGDPELPRRNRAEPEEFQAGAGSKSKPCVRFFSTAGCRFGSNCHFIHDIPAGSHAVAETSIPSGPAPAPAQDEEELVRLNPTPPPLVMDKPRPTGDHALRAPTPPNAAPAMSKITVDASLAGAVIGRGGATIREISRASGARLRIRDHERDAGLKNVELEGTPDQIRHASAMVWEHLPVLGGGRYNGVKTRLCAHFARGSCTYGDGCRFAHSESELRRPAPAPRDPCGW
ncbi:zinc finger CCCH domain-containing protein 52-like isoform X1 [Aegilops tauschii subsp. strangulata]|uniref:zinc finger CCCH domain-containing protein 52-like isoform X1 n=2 Tax=Triticinae TaxID=1648030 RepID=UPI001ABCA573|nr:zinc finger CCCH domain-containing protein 14-like isoform X1 [Aegilops tauschii subsp. strangulata]